MTQRFILTRYLRDIFALVGISDLEVVVAEGLAFGPDASAASVQMAMSSIDALPAMAI